MQSQTPRNPEPTPVPPSTPVLVSADLVLVLLGGVLLLVAIPWLPAIGLHPPAWVSYYATHLWAPVWLIGGLLAGGPLLGAGWPWLERGLRFGRAQFIDYGGGFYGAVALTCFVWLEAVRLRAEWGDFVLEPSWPGLWSHILDFSIASVMNGIWAVAWPGFLQKIFDSGNAWPAIAVAYGWFEGARRLVTHLPRRAMR